MYNYSKTCEDYKATSTNIPIVESVLKWIFHQYNTKYLKRHWDEYNICKCTNTTDFLKVIQLETSCNHSILDLNLDGSEAANKIFIIFLCEPY